MKRYANIALTVVVVVLAILVGWMVASKFGLVAPPIKQSKIDRLIRTTTGNPKHKNAYLSVDDPTIKVDDLGPRKWKIIDVHEHLKGEPEAKMLLKEMDKLGIQRTSLMGSTTYTLTLNPIYGFEGWKDNNESLLKVKKAHPGRFAVFVTFDPCDDEDKVALVKDYLARGADGVKLYLGHGAHTPKFAFHCEPIDAPNMEPFFAFAEDAQIPIVLHVNLGKYWDEMLDVLEKHPYLRVNMPHFGLSKNSGQKLKRLAFLLNRYPYAYTDVSFGYYTYQLDGYENLAMWRSRSKEWLTQERDKVMFASDMVLEPSKDQPYIENTLRAYMQFLEKERWRVFLVPSKTMHGMGLDDETLHHIYEVAPHNFLLMDDKGNLPDRTKDPRVEVPRPPVPPLTPDMIPPLRLPRGGAVPAHGAADAGVAAPVDAGAQQGSSEPEGDDEGEIDDDVGGGAGATAE